MLDVARIRAISIDLDDTLWPIWPTIIRAEQAMHAWLALHAPATAQNFPDAAALRALRQEVDRARQDLQHDLSALRLESLKLAMQRSGDDAALADAAFDVFFAERQRIDFFDDALAGLQSLAARYPLLALTNGNADLARVGIAQHFHGYVSARSAGFAKPDVRIFRAAADALGVPADQVLHVGDDAAMDVIGALDAGMQAAWINAERRPWSAGPRAPQLDVPGMAALCGALGLELSPATPA